MGKLTRLELFNFKSYKGHHVLLFGDAYFTSIIGPNGSGKSNSMDAISFVLGIKSSHLRSAHLRELIYRGRVLQKSTIGEDGGIVPKSNGHTNGVNGDHEDSDDDNDTQTQRDDPKSAWVMAVYEDDAGDEQCWKRVITRAGVSEYRINERVVTAQQYNEALEAENILIKARNFLVFQGDVEAIAQQSPKDLTRLVEQISGSLEYKAEYERLEAEQEAALENQTYHLNRRRGINTEVKQYQEQKREAETHANKADERDQAIVTHVLWKLYHFQKLIEESAADIEKYQHEMQEHRRGVEKHEKRMTDAQKEAAKATRETEKILREIKKQEKEIEEKEREIEPYRTKVESCEKRNAKVTARVAEIQKEIDGHESALQSYRKDLKTVEKARQQWEKQVAQAEKSRGQELSDADHEQYGKLRARVNVDTAAQQGNLDTASRLMKTNEETVNSLKSKMDSARWRTDQLDSAMAENKENIKKQQVIHTQTSSEVDAKKVELAAYRSEASKISDTRRELDEKLQVVLNKLIEADGAQRESRKEERLREIMAKLRRYFPGVKGRIFDLCKPKMKKWGEAVSTVLGRHLDEVVVDTEKTARECIQYLHEEQLGLLTFIPLDTIQTKTASSTLRTMHRGMRSAIDAIDFDQALERAMIYSTGNAVICDDLSIAKWVCYDKGIEVKAVTLDGTIIHKGGNMTGGHGPSDRGGKRWEDSEVANLKKVREDIMEQHRSLPKQDDRTKEENLSNELRQLERRLQRTTDEIQAFKRNLESKEKEFENADDQLAEVQPKHEEAQKDLQQLKGNYEKYQKAVYDVEDKIFAEFCKRLGYENIRAYEAQQGSLQQEASQKKLEFTSQKSKLDNQIAFEEKRLSDTKRRLDKVQADIAENKKMVSELETAKAALEDASDTLAANLELMQKRLAQQKSVKDERTKKVNEAREEHRKRLAAMNNDQKNIADLDAQVQRTASERYTLLRRCKLEDITLPLADESASLDDLPVDEVLVEETAPPADPDAMDVDSDPNETRLASASIRDYGIILDFEDLDSDLQESPSPSTEAALQARITTLNADLEKLSPNTRAMERLDTASSRLRTTDQDYEAARRTAQRARSEFSAVKQARTDLFMAAFTHISEHIDGIYKDLTRSANFPLGGQAYLDLLDDQAPFAPGSTGVKYHVTPPLKRFRDLASLSGGEKTIAALALLFAVHGFQPSPFFVLDEVDAALDNTNVERVRRYLEKHSGPGMQCIVISLKTGLFEGSEGLVGVWRDQGEGTSRVLTLDLRKYQAVEEAG